MPQALTAPTWPPEAEKVYQRMLELREHVRFKVLKDMWNDGAWLRSQAVRRDARRSVRHDFRRRVAQAETPIVGEIVRLTNLYGPREEA